MIVSQKGTTRDMSPAFGNPRYLEVALKVLAAERELWGIGCPPSTPPSAAEESMTLERTDRLTVRRPRGDS